MPCTVAPTPDTRILYRDAEWLVTQLEPSDYSHKHHAVRCVGADDLVWGHEAVFLTQLDHIEPVDPCNTQLVPDYPAADIHLDSIGELLQYSVPAMAKAD